MRIGNDGWGWGGDNRESNCGNWLASVGDMAGR